MKRKNIIILIILAVVTISLAALSYLGIGPDHLLGVQNIKQGLDLKGGVAITYEADKQSPSAEEMSSALSLLRQRLDRKNYTEAEVAIQGTKRLRIDIPDVDDVETAISDIGKTAMLMMVDEEGKVILTGDSVKNAYKTVTTDNNQNNVVVALEFDDAGKMAFEQATEENIGKRILILLDDEILSAPMVNEKISGGNAIITGGFTTAEAEELSALIRSGSLPFKLNILSTSNIGAKLGANSLVTSLNAGVIGFALVLVFMVGVYRLSGLAADWALIIYLALELLILSLFKVTLTLPGIAGIILSIGMAVDANIIIFERIKEEIEYGRSMRSALDAGFSRAFPAIMDGNITTLIAAMVLFWLGTGPIKGFAQTLAIGIVISMFTALFITRMILKAFVGVGLTNTKLYAINKTEVSKIKANQEADNKALPQIQIIRNRKKFFITSSLIILIGCSFMVVHYTRGGGALNYDVEFSGGTSLLIDLGQPFDNDDIINIIQETTGQMSPQVQKIIGTNEVNVKTKLIEQEQRIALVNKLKETYSIDDTSISFEDVSPTVSSEMRNIAIKAVLVASLAMLVYVSIRFRDIRKGSSSIIALIHDALVMITAYAILRIPLNYSFIAAILTILGYSINSTIVIFDRIRENQRLLNRPSKEELINISVTQTLKRSLYTSITTLITITALYIMGVTSVKDFALPIIIGVIAGTYSSVCLAGSFWYVMMAERKS